MHARCPYHRELLALLGAFVVSASGCAVSNRALIDNLADEVILDRTGPADATVGMISLPLPRSNANALSVDHPSAGVQTVGWWELNRTPRRVMAFVVGVDGIPQTLRLKQGARRPGQASQAWTVGYNTTLERLTYKRVPAWEYNTLRGFAAADCTLVEGEVMLTYGGRTVSLQLGATGPDEGSAGPDSIYYWQNVQIDRLWSNQVAQAVRLGGIIYNSDTFLWADVYLLLFNNGVGQVAVHFSNTRLAIDGYDFVGLPVVRFSGAVAGAEVAEHALPADGMRHQLGTLDLNLSPAQALSSNEEPGRLIVNNIEALWYPFNRVCFPHDPKPEPRKWLKGMARTVQFTMSLSDAAPVVTRYRAPAWWYAECGEFGPWKYLPVAGPMSLIADQGMRDAAEGLARGRFDAGRGYDDGGLGLGLLRFAYRSGDPRIFDAGLTYCIYWTDLMLDHDDHTVHQLTSWPYKTAAYTKFSDVIFAWLETGDPYYLDNAEMTAEGYYAWHRSNWPRNTIGRDNYPLGGWALLWKYMDDPHARDRTIEMVRMNRVVFESRGTFGGQMGAGPHSGYHDSLFLTGVAMESLLDVAEVMIERGDTAGGEQIVQMLTSVTPHFMRDDREYYPSHFGQTRSEWKPYFRASWRLKTLRIYPELARMRGIESGMLNHALAKAEEHVQRWSGRDTTLYLAPSRSATLMLGARHVDDGVEINPLASPEFWAKSQDVSTRFGELNVELTDQLGGTTLSFSCVKRFSVTIRYNGLRYTTTSQGTCCLDCTHSSRWPR